MRRYGSKAVSVTHNQTILRSVIVMADDPDRLDRNSLSRSYGVPVDVVGRLIRDEKVRRVMSR